MKTKRILQIAMMLAVCVFWGHSAFWVMAAETPWNSGKETVSSTVDVRSGDFTQALQTELNKARDDKRRAYEITIPAGSYKVDKTLHIYSNTRLNMDGVTLQFTSKDGNMLMPGTAAMNTLKDTSYSKATGYNGYENIYLYKGTWKANNKNDSCVIRFLHGKNITMDQVTVSGCGAKHQVEVCALDGFYVKGCNFRDFTHERDKDRMSKFEALQLDVPCADKVYVGVYEDGTMMKNVYVEDCTFVNVPRGVGTHTQLLGSYHENIYIRNNTFRNIGEEAVVALNYYNCEISGNTITNCGAGILVQNMKKNSSTIFMTTEDKKYTKAKDVRNDLKTRILNNKITIKYTKDSDEIQAIKIYGRKLSKAEKASAGKKIPVGNYYISGITVSGNRIQTAGHGIHLMDARNCTIKNNVITGKGFSSKDSKAKSKKYDGIFLEAASTGCKISGNTIQSALRNGVFIYDGSSVKDFSGNTIVSSGKYGVGIGKKSKSTGNFKKNVVKSSKSSGIFVSESSTAASIKENTITNSGEHGIGLWKKCSVKGAIEKNTIKNSGEKGISLSTNCSAGSITGNKITKAKGYGIFIYNKSKVKKVKKNTIKSTKKPAIRYS